MRLLAAALTLAALHAAPRVDPPGRGPVLMLAEANRAYERSLALGAKLWKTRTAPLSANGQSCAGCHRTAASLAGAIKRYPRHDRATGRVIPLEQQVALCIQQRMRGQAPAAGSSGSVALLVHLKEGR